MLRRKIPQFEIASIYICNDDIYLPTLIRYDTEQAIEGEPVFHCKPEKTQVVDVLKKVLETQQPRIPHPGTEAMNEIFKSPSVMLKATKKKSMKAFAKDYDSFMIVWNTEEIIIWTSQLDKKGRYEFPNSLKTKFPKETTLDELVDFVLQTYKDRKKSEN